MRRYTFLSLLLATAVLAQTPAPTAPDPSAQLVWVCPMDKDIRSLGPGNCPRCGMKLATDVPDPAEQAIRRDSNYART